MVSRPRVKSMRKKMMAQKGDSGSRVRASGYTTNAMPGPDTHTHTDTEVLLVFHEQRAAAALVLCLTFIRHPLYWHLQLMCHEAND